MTTTRGWALRLLLGVAACGRGEPTTAPVIAPPTAPAPTGPRAVLRSTYGVDGDAAAVQLTAEIMGRRFALLGIPGVTARADGVRVVVELPELSHDDVARIRDVAARVGHLSVHGVDSGALPMLAIAAHAAQDVEAAQTGVRMEADAWRDLAGHDVHDAYLVADDRTDQVTVQEAARMGCMRRDLPVEGGLVRCKVTGRHVIERYLTRLATSDPPQTVADDRMIRFERVPPMSWRSHHLERAIALDGAAITRATPGPAGSDAEVLIDLDATGARALEALSRTFTGRKIAIVLDGRVMAAPIVMGTIKSGRMSLPLGDGSDHRDAEELAIVLAGGALPAAVIEETSEQLGAQE